MEIADIIARWDSGEGRPYKGTLIDWQAYAANPSDIGCMCAQGQVLHLVGGWSAEKLAQPNVQNEADKATAALLGISVAHAILLRSVNDRADGAPSVVLTHPEKIIGDQAPTILAFWRHLDRMTDEQWAAAWAAARAAGDAARAAARAAAWAAARAARAAAWAAARAAARAAGDAASYVVAEIMGARVLRERGQAFFFLPMFGFADPEAVLAADREAA